MAVQSVDADLDRHCNGHLTIAQDQKLRALDHIDQPNSLVARLL